MTSSGGKKTSVPHLERTAAEPRQNRLYNVHLSHIEQVNPSVRLFQLAIPPQNVETPESDDAESSAPQPFSFLPGQWLDVHIPSVSRAGGFSITSTPADAQVLPAPEPATEFSTGGEDEAGLSAIESQGRPPYVELAVQHAPENPASAWLWQPQSEIQGKQLTVRVGGSFVWPPSGLNLEGVRNVTLIAGGMGINPIISILSHLNNNVDEITALQHPFNIHLLYSTKLPPSTDTSTASSESYLAQVLFLSRLRQIIRGQSQSRRLRISLNLFLTNLSSDQSSLLQENPAELTVHSRRISESDLQKTLTGSDGKANPNDTVYYVCGPPKMTDELVNVLGGLGSTKENVFFEKWW
ncbi:hypothetical protein P170DRAFT_432793 [Aspergillus steynii IBT 23096]|uniref:FAD-binding FR-type domain-containing protein n=1 Tax=Aspergillus steynii IBT 23096 TaxID=1392250 RepID=A0A2I2GQX2_9EURO|nr:uncharacterized protein P170DRAFT_432793 [Aspergillus steynii IBT 23096]PLB55263.1 hypothetical protein P170DRAFT_432793 [Aspergillus steynii IBT 23096]